MRARAERGEDPLHVYANFRVRDVTLELNTMGFEVVGTSPKEFAAHVRAEVEKWAKVVRESGAKLE